MQRELSETDFLILWKQVEHFLNITQSLMKIMRKTYTSGTVSGFYFLFSEETTFTNWEDFKALFRQHPTLFLSNHDESAPALFAEAQEGLCLPSSLIFLTSLGKLADQLEVLIRGGREAIFIVSTIKEESRKLFEAVQKMPFADHYQLLVENITGGAGKNIFNAKKQGRFILIGGYSFLLSCYAQKLRFDTLLIRNIRGAQSQGILDDIRWYSPK